MTALAATPLPEDEQDRIVRQLAALAHTGRLTIFRELVKVFDEANTHHGLAAGELSRRLHMPPSTLSFHLKELARADLLASEKDGRSVIYRINGQSIRALVNFMLEDCCSECC